MRIGKRRSPSTFVRKVEDGQPVLFTSIIWFGKYGD